MKKYSIKLIETYVFDFEVEAKNRVEAEEKAKEKVCESFLLPPITYGITNPEEHYITCKKRTTEATL